MATFSNFCNQYELLEPCFVSLYPLQAQIPIRSLALLPSQSVNHPPPLINADKPDRPPQSRLRIVQRVLLRPCPDSPARWRSALSTSCGQNLDVIIGEFLWQSLKKDGRNCVCVCVSNDCFVCVWNCVKKYSFFCLPLELSSYPMCFTASLTTFW